MKYKRILLKISGEALAGRSGLGLDFKQAKKLAHEIAAQPPMAVRMAKEAVLKALDVDLDAGLALERRLFYSLFDTGDQKEAERLFCFFFQVQG